GPACASRHRTATTATGVLTKDATRPAGVSIPTTATHATTETPARPATRARVGRAWAARHRTATTATGVRPTRATRRAGASIPTTERKGATYGTGPPARRAPRGIGEDRRQST